MKTIPLSYQLLSFISALLLSALAQAQDSRDLRTFFAVGFQPSLIPMEPDWYRDLPAPNGWLRAPAVQLANLGPGGGAFDPSNARIQFRFRSGGLPTGSEPVAALDSPILLATASGLYDSRVLTGLQRVQQGASATVSGSGVTDRYTVGSLSRRTTRDGFEYEAVSVNLERNEQPLLTLHLGYRLGLVASTPNPSAPAGTQDHYELATLPPPTVEGMITEYVHLPAVSPSTPWGHFFYAASDGDRALLDASTAWQRTGREFKSGGYVPVCRFFYRPPAGGPATHFYTAKADECERFKTQPGFVYEGTPFRASLPRPPAAGQSADDFARCPSGTLPLRRYFNQPGSAAIAPNHRYVMSPQMGSDMATGYRGAQPWAAEGIAFCVPE